MRGIGDLWLIPRLCSQLLAQFFGFDDDEFPRLEAEGRRTEASGINQCIDGLAGDDFFGIEGFGGIAPLQGVSEFGWCHKGN